MKWKLFFCCVLLVSLLSGCYTTKTFVKYEGDKTEAVTEAKEGVELMLKNLEFRLGLLDGILHPYLQDVPPSIISAVKELKVLVIKYKKEGTLDDYDLGQALGIQIRLRGEVAQAVIKKYAPGVLKYLML